MKSASDVIDIKRSIVPGFKVDAKGVHWEKETDNGFKLVWLCSPLIIDARLFQKGGQDWSYRLLFKDAYGNEHVYLLPSASLVGSTDLYQRELISRGLELNLVERDAARQLRFYIQKAGANARKFVKAVSKTGWHDQSFVIPGRTIGDQRITFHSDDAHVEFNSAGNVDDWRENVSKKCVGNSRLIFGISTSFSAYLMGPCGVEGGAYHFRGESTDGKTTCLNVSASVVSNPTKNTPDGEREPFVQSWNTTANGMETLGAMHNDLMLPMDELHLCSATKAGEVAYSSAQGAGKKRADRSGKAKPRAVYQCVILSSGEIGLNAHLSSVGQTSKAGMEIRFLDIPSDAGKEMGIFESLNGFAKPANMANYLNKTAGEYFGTAGLAFVEKLLETNQEKIEPDLKWMALKARESCNLFIKKTVPVGASAQVLRAAERFAFVAFAGERATEYGITGWKHGDAAKAAEACFKAWLSSRGGMENLEKMRAIEQVRTLFAAHGASRFSQIELVDQEGEKESDHFRTINRLGFRKTTHFEGKEIEIYLCFKESFEKEICANYDPQSVRRWLAEAGYLLKGTDGKLTQPHRNPLTKQAERFVTISSAILSQKEDA